MITVNLKGGLGNQLFQIYTCIAHAWKIRSGFYFPYITKNIRQTYWDTLFIKLKPYLEEELKLYRNTGIFIYVEPVYEYTVIPEYDNICLEGYFQSDKYFIDYYERICSVLHIRDMQLDVYKKHVQLFNKKTISVHFRIGDYIEKQDKHLIQNIMYYKNAIQHILKLTKCDDYNVLFFCEEKDDKEVLNKVYDLCICFPQLIFIKVNNDIPDYEQLLLMSMCTHHVIANSTFSWWGAYLNLSKSKIVMCPKKWYGKKKPLSIKDLIFKKCMLI